MDSAQALGMTQGISSLAKADVGSISWTSGNGAFGPETGFARRDTSRSGGGIPAAARK